MTTTAPDKISMPAHVLRASDLDEDQLGEVLRNAERMKRSPYRLTTGLAGRTLVMLCEQPAAESRVALAAAAHRLGMLPVVLRGDELAPGDESVEDLARVLSGYSSAIAVATPEQARLERLAAAATVPVINALSDDHHPCQALADLLTLHEHFGRLEGLRVAYVGAAGNVAHSLLEMGARAGLHVAISAPADRGPDPDVVAVARGLSVLHGGSITVPEDPETAVSNADVVYTGPWGDRGSAGAHQVGAALMGAARRDAVFMHCLPAHRGHEVTADVIDGPRSLVFQQAANRLPTAQALLHALVLASEH